MRRFIDRDSRLTDAVAIRGALAGFAAAQSPRIILHGNVERHSSVE